MDVNLKMNRARLMMSAATGLVLLMSGAAWAQTDDPAAPVAAKQPEAPEAEDSRTLDKVMITGIRSSIENSLLTKRNADTLVEVVTAEDIGRLPDVSIADSLSRLPGVTSQRTSGQASGINIRGLSQQLTFSTLNGREQVTLNGGRSVEFEQYPSELLASAQVYKSPKASLIEGGLAGTVELKTIRPLDYGSRKLAFNSRGSYSDRADEIYEADDSGYRVSVSYIDQLFDNTLGITLGYARLVQPDISSRFVGFDFSSSTTDFDSDGEADVYSFGFDAELAGGTDTRDGFVGTLQWQPTERFSWEIDSYYSRFVSDTVSRNFGTRVFGQVSDPRFVRVENPIVTGDALVGGQFTRLRPAGQNGLRVQTGVIDNKDTDDLLSIASKLEYVITERLSASVDVSYASAESRLKNATFVHLPLQSGPPSPRFDANVFLDFTYNGVDLPTINSITPDLDDLSSIYLTRGNLSPTDNEDELIAVSGDLDYEAGGSFFSSFEAGFRYSTRDASQTRASADIGTVNGTNFNGLTPIALTPENSVTRCFSGKFAKAGFPCFSTIIDPQAAIVAASGPIEFRDPPPTFVLQESFTVSEDVIAGYAQANIATNFLSVPVDGNVGVRVVKTDQSSAALASVAPGELSYTRVLPSANVIFHVTEQDQIRLAASRALSRPSLFGLGAGFSLSFNGTALTGGGSGNPALVPFLATQGDVSYERYFKNGGAFVAGAFYKSLETFIVQDRDESFDFSGLNIEDLLSPSDLADYQAAGSPTVGILNGVINGEGGYIWGIELGYTQNFDQLPAPFDGFGISANYSYTDSEIAFTSSSSGRELSLPLPGLSTHVANSTIFYDKNGFSTRVGLRHRSKFISPQAGLGTQLPFTDAETVLDYQASYEFQGGPMEGLTMFFQANNLTDEPVITYFGQEAQTGTIQYFGRQLFFGASYSF